eukprot:6388763-Lingulodinium_polyedra.AAC.1
MAVDPISAWPAAGSTTAVPAGTSSQEDGASEGAGPPRAPGEAAVAALLGPPSTGRLTISPCRRQ